MLKIFFFICFTANFLVDCIPVYESVIKGRILGGNDTDISKAPYMAAEFVHNTFLCGAFIVSPTHVVTTARCLVIPDASVLSIRVGSNNNKEGGVVVKAKQIHIHPKFRAWDYDVGIIELATPLNLNEKTMKAIKLGTKEPNAGSIVFISGWGFTTTNLDSPDILQSITVPVYDRTKCEKIYREGNVTITPRMMCGTADGKMPVMGDVGGPVVYKGEAVGIISFGVGEFAPGTPTVYTNIAHPEITKFIKDIVKF